MLAKLINTLFGQQNPQADLAARLAGEFQGWLAPITEQQPVGEDPSYDDDFQLLKDEMTKLSGIDAAMIVEVSERLTRTHCKDIRVLSYYCWAKLRLEGAGGLADGLTLIAGLLRHYGDTLYPRRPESRKLALEWLASSKFIDILESISPLGHQELTRAIAALSLIIEITSQWPEQGRPDLQSLIQVFERQFEHPEPIQTAAEQAVTPTSTSVAFSDNVGSLRDVVDQARKMAFYLRDKPEGYLPAVRLMRTIRWDTVTLPPPHNEKGYTRLHPPRAELRQHLNRLWLQKQWLELLEQAERAFAEAANHFWLDLQRYACEALANAGLPYSLWRDICITDVALMIDRLKGIESLYYSDGTPFADDETRQWIATTATVNHLDEGQALAPMPIDISGQLDWQEIELQAIDLADRDGLESAFNWLQSLPAIQSEKQRYFQRFVLARVAEQQGQREIAIRLLEPLSQQVGDYSLTSWEPDLLFDVNARLLKLLQQKMLLKEADKPALTKQIDELLKQLTDLNPARALTL